MKKTISIIGGGPAAMLLAAHLNNELFDVTIYERNKALGRKFLVAGKGGFNLSHGEEMEQFVDRYTPSNLLKEALLSFTNEDLRTWLKALNIPTFIGSSNRIYPEKGIKPIEVLTSVLDDLEQRGVQFRTTKGWTGWNNKSELLFDTGLAIKSDITIFALGGGSWKKTGSSGEWINYFSDKEIKTIPFEASNCAYEIDWKNDFLIKNEGKPIKNIKISCNNSSKVGEIVITEFGLEGGAIYALSPQVREQLNQHKKARITIDLKPALTEAEIKVRLSIGKVTEQLKKTVKLEKPKIDLLKTYLNKEEFLDVEFLAKTIKAFPLEIIGRASLDEAISTVGGIGLDEVDDNFELHQMKNNYVVGEMLDYDAPTGGYLLQSCFSMGVFVANHLNAKYEKS